MRKLSPAGLGLFSHHELVALYRLPITFCGEFHSVHPVTRTHRYVRARAHARGASDGSRRNERSEREAGEKKR